MDNNQAPRLVGFNFQFIKFYYDILQSEVLALFDWFFHLVYLDPHLSKSFLTLISMMSNPLSINHFFSISSLKWVHP